MKTLKIIKLIVSHILIISLLASGCKTGELITRSDPEFIHARDSIIEKTSLNYEIGDVFTVYYSDTDFVIQKMESGNEIIDVKYYEDPIGVRMALLLIVVLVSFLIIDIIK